MEKENLFYVLINGMDLTGKTSLANRLKDDCIDKNVQILHSSFSRNNPLNALASKLRREREQGTFSKETLNELYKFAKSKDPVLCNLLKTQYPVISDEAIGHIYAQAIAEELENFHPSTSIIHDSSTIIKTLTLHKFLCSGPGLMKKLETLRLCHPQPTKANYSILLESSPEAKVDRLNKRIKKGEFVSEIDLKVLSNTDAIQRQAEIMRDITIHTFPGTLVFDTTNMTETEVFDVVRNHLDICKGREI